MLRLFLSPPHTSSMMMASTTNALGKNMQLDDTIVAISTPPGRGGLGVVRLSGPEARDIASRLLRLASARELEPSRARFAELIDLADGARIDECIVTWFAAPHSYTTDDLIEISCHGSPVVLRRAVEMALTCGARLAGPGEFTQRAFLHGRLDLTQAEAVHDLIEAQTPYQAKIAAEQLKGSLAHAIAPIKQELVALIARLEAGIDFADDDVDVLPDQEITAALDKIDPPLARLEASFRFGKLVHEGVTLAIVGRPNVGKSSLFNQLIERDRAIVTAQPGTTRDLVSETVALGGVPVRLVDTAGIRQASNEAEAIGVRKSSEALAEADLVLVVLDASQPLDATDCQLLAEIEDRAAIVICNKCDLLESNAISAETFPSNCAAPKLFTSARNGEGLAELRTLILTRLRGATATEGGAMLTNLRQQSQVSAAVRNLDAARTSLACRVPHEMLLVDLYSSLHALDELTGATTTDDILGKIFSTFCIGK